MPKKAKFKPSKERPKAKKSKKGRRGFAGIAFDAVENATRGG
jgi:hypothetical protein